MTPTRKSLDLILGPQRGASTAPNLGHVLPPDQLLHLFSAQLDRLSDFVEVGCSS